MRMDSDVQDVFTEHTLDDPGAQKQSSAQSHPADREQGQPSVQQNPEESQLRGVPLVNGDSVSAASSQSLLGQNQLSHPDRAISILQQIAQLGREFLSLSPAPCLLVSLIRSLVETIQDSDIRYLLGQQASTQMTSTSQQMSTQLAALQQLLSGTLSSAPLPAQNNSNTSGGQQLNFISPSSSATDPSQEMKELPGLAMLFQSLHQQAGGQGLAQAQLNQILAGAVGGLQQFQQGALMPGSSAIGSQPPPPPVLSQFNIGGTSGSDAATQLQNLLSLLSQQQQPPPGGSHQRGS
jgi:hypothetical protein